MLKKQKKTLKITKNLFRTSYKKDLSNFPIKLWSWITLLENSKIDAEIFASCFKSVYATYISSYETPERAQLQKSQTLSIK